MMLPHFTAKRLNENIIASFVEATSAFHRHQMLWEDSKDFVSDPAPAVHVVMVDRMRYHGLVFFLEGVGEEVTRSLVKMELV